MRFSHLLMAAPLVGWLCAAVPVPATDSDDTAHDISLTGLDNSMGDTAYSSTADANNQAVAAISHQGAIHPAHNNCQNDSEDMLIRKYLTDTLHITIVTPGVVTLERHGGSRPESCTYLNIEEMDQIVWSTEGGYSVVIKGPRGDHIELRQSLPDGRTRLLDEIMFDPRRGLQHRRYDIRQWAEWVRIVRERSQMEANDHS